MASVVKQLAVISVLASTSEARIVGGDQVDISQIPFVVSVQNKEGHFCGGSVISSSWILTAAHCIDPSDVLSIRAGSTQHATGGQLVPVKRAISHPKYNEATVDYDFALLELKDKLQQFSAVDLPKQDEPVVDGSVLQVSGWGSTLNPLESEEYLRAAKVLAVNQDKCIKAFTTIGDVTPRMLCAGTEQGNRDACQGDSGGPLANGNKLVGVVSWGEGCAEVGFPGIYSRVAAVRDWIKTTSGV